MDRIDILTGTLGKALGGASGGYTSGRKEIIELLRQRSRPYLFSNTLCPRIAGASLKVLDLLSQLDRAARPAGGEHALLPRRHGPARLHDPARRRTRSCRSCSATPRWPRRLADAMLPKGVYVIGFSYPVVPKGKARIRTQISAAHTRADLEMALDAFAAVKREMGL